MQAQLPSVVGRVTDEIGIHIDQLLDPKIMVIDHFQKNPALVVRIFRDFGQRELDLMVVFGFVFGFLLGIPVAVVDSIAHQWWLLPVLGVGVGWITNALGMWLIFEPPEPKKLLGVIPVHGLFLRRQDEAAEVYARIIAEDVITLERIGDFLLDGPRGDRTRQMLATAMRPAIDKAAGPARGAVGWRWGRPLRHDPRLGGQGGRRSHADAVPRPGVLGAAGRQDPGTGGHHAPRAAPGRLRGDDALGDQGG